APRVQQIEVASLRRRAPRRAAGASVFSSLAARAVASKEGSMDSVHAGGDQASSLDAEGWPSLPLEAWRDTRATLHMYTQVVGKVRLALAPMEPQWGQVPLYVTSRGLSTSPIPCRDRTFTFDFDLLAHELVMHASDGAIRTLALRPLPVARFYDEVMEE